MKIVYAIACIALLAALAEAFLPWWVIAPVAFIITYLFQLRGWRAFVAGFVAMLLLWGGRAAYIDTANAHILSARIAVLLHISTPSLLIVITALMGGLVGGLSSLSASFLVQEYQPLNRV